MLPKYKSRTNIGIGLGFVLQLLPRLMGFPPVLAGLCAIAGTILFIWGCCSYAIAKGHSWAWGLLGFLSLLGLIILLFLPDRNKATS